MQMSGRSTPEIERIGDTVRRPTGAHSPFVHALLRHLEARTFAGAPRWLGLEPSGREILSYVPGYVPPDLGAFSDDQCLAAARLLRALHDSTVDFEGRGTGAVVCHGDASPCNCVFVNGLPRAFIDFDAAHPGDRLAEVGYAAWLWLDIGNTDLDPARQGRRLAAFVTAYRGLKFTKAVAAVIDSQRELSEREGAPAETRQWAKQCLQWSTKNREAIEAGAT